ncbi:ATP-binding protein [Haloarculaceae archaeon H-GB2-1]|nr:ATP-binding protein [Haloarculaceae archaeon H-GB2-1]
MGHREADLSVADWVTILDENPRVVLEKHNHVGTEEWRAICATICEAVRRLQRDQLVVVDEAHFVAPQAEKLPDPVKHIATTGRGAGTSSMWVTQRLSECDNTVLTQCQARMLGGFEGGDLGRVSEGIEYPEALHNPAADLSPSGIPEQLLPAGRERPVTLQKHKDEQDRTIGSEWIYSDDDGEKYRVNTQTVSMDSTHYGSRGNKLAMPEYA